MRQQKVNRDGESSTSLKTREVEHESELVKFTGNEILPLQSIIP